MGRHRMRLFEKTSSTVFEALGDWGQVIEQLRQLRLEQRELIQLAVIGSRENLADFLRSDRSPPGLDCLNSTDRLTLFNYERRFGRDRQHREKGRFLLARSSVDFVYLMLFVAPPHFWRHGLSPLVDLLYPRAAPPFLTQAELHRLLKITQRAMEPNLGMRVLELSSKKRLTAAARKRFQSVREWTDADLDSVFREARDRNEWFKSVSFGLVTEQDGRVASTGIRASMSKYGYFSCNGQFDLFERTVVQELVQIAAERLEFFANRDRFRTPHHVPKPMQISYESEIFRSSDQTRKLIDALHRLKHGTCTALHANPYVHLSIVDNLDYSSADVWVVSQNQILIVPQLRASEVGLKRIVNHIFEHFSEGKLSEYQGQET